jgi:Ohr subfamily peroxiredoxin
MNMPHYTAVATAEGGRNGHVASADGHIHLDLSIPKELGGPGKTGATNPEALFASGYAACFGSAVDHVAKMQKLPVTDVKVTAHVTLNAGESGFDLATKLHVTVHGVDHATAEKLVHEAHEVCPYSKATRGNMPVELTVA